jgi:hypothetical protein
MAAEKPSKPHMPLWVQIFFVGIFVCTIVLLILARIRGGMPW